MAGPISTDHAAARATKSQRKCGSGRGWGGGEGRRGRRPRSRFNWVRELVRSTGTLKSRARRRLVKTTNSKSVDVLPAAALPILNHCQPHDLASAVQSSILGPLQKTKQGVTRQSWRPVPPFLVAASGQSKTARLDSHGPDLGLDAVVNMVGSPHPKFYQPIIHSALAWRDAQH